MALFQFFFDLSGLEFCKSLSLNVATENVDVPGGDGFYSYAVYFDEIEFAFFGLCRR